MNRCCAATLALLAFVQSACVLPPVTFAPYGPVREVAQLADERINEASGIVASRLNPNAFYIINDSGDGARVFLVDRTGATRATITLADARNVDYEDIALAPGDAPDQFDVCVADIGDNNHERKHVTLYRFAEIDLDSAVADVSVTPTTVHVRYAGGPVDAEALIVHPKTGDGYIFTKRRDGKPADVYRLAAPWPKDGVTELPRVAEVEIAGRSPFERFITAADISPDGRNVAVRTYVGGWEWRLMAGEMDVTPALGQSPRALRLAAEPQGEALCYAADGDTLLTVSEKTPTYLFEVRRER